MTLIFLTHLILPRWQLLGILVLSLIPPLQTQLATGDILVFMGTSEQIKKFLDALEHKMH